MRDNTPRVPSKEESNAPARGMIFGLIAGILMWIGAMLLAAMFVNWWGR